MKKMRTIRLCKADNPTGAYTLNTEEGFQGIVGVVPLNNLNLSSVTHEFLKEALGIRQIHRYQLPSDHPLYKSYKNGGWGGLRQSKPFSIDETSTYSEMLEAFVERHGANKSVNAQLNDVYHLWDIDEIETSTGAKPDSWYTLESIADRELVKIERARKEEEEAIANGEDIAIEVAKQSSKPEMTGLEKLIQVGRIVTIGFLSMVILITAISILIQIS